MIKGTRFLGVVLLLICFKGLFNFQKAQAQANDHVVTLEWSPDGTRIAAYWASGALEVRNVAIGTTVFSDTTRQIIEDLAWSPDGEYIAVVYDRVEIISSSSGTSIRQLPINNLRNNLAYFDAIAWNPESELLAGIVRFGVGSLAETFVYVWDSSDGTILNAYPTKGDFIEWSPTGNHLAIANTSSVGSLTIIDAISGDALLDRGSDLSIGIAWKFDGLTLAQAVFREDASGLQPYILIWDLRDGSVQRTLHRSDSNQILALDWRPGGDELAVSDAQLGIDIWDATPGTLLLDRFVDDHYVTALGWSPDGTRLAFGNEDGTIEIVPVLGTAPMAPFNLAALRLSANSIRLDWTDNSTDESEFRIERSENGIDGWTEIHTLAPDETTYTDEDLDFSTVYYYRVRAYRGSDNQYSEYSNIVDILTIPATPLNLAVSAVPFAKTNLSWEDNSSDETTFSIERSPDGSTDWVEIDTVPADTIAYEDSDLTPSTTYWYRVRAHRESDNQFSDYTPSVSVLTAPSGPSQVTATLSAPNQIQVSWTDNSTDETNFRIERSTTGTSDWSEIGTATATPYTDSTTNPSTTYYYRVRAYRNSDNVFSDYSAAASGILSSPATPASFAGVPLPINKAKLTWTDNTTDETNFRLERSDNGTSGWSEIVIAANQVAYTESRTNCIQTSYFRIRAYRGSDNQYSVYSPIVSVTTDGCGPDRLALFNTVHTHNRRFTEFPGTTYNDYWLNAPVGSGQWFMGDWNGDGVDTPAVFINGTYWYTNSQAASSTWTQINVQANEYPVVGRFDLSVGHDCLGVIDSILFPPTTVFMLGYTCNLTGDINPSLSYQWLGGILPDGQYTGEYQFVSGDWNGDGVDTIAARRSEYIAYTNVAPGQNAAFDQAQYFGNPYNGQYGGLYGVLVAGDWNYDGIDTFGYFYVDGNFYWRNHLEWNQPISGSALISNPYGTNVLPTTWRN